MSSRWWSKLFHSVHFVMGPERAPPSRYVARRLGVELLEDRTLLSGDSLLTAMPISPTGTVIGSVGTVGEVDFFQVVLSESGRLTVRTQAAPDSSLDSRTSLLGPEGQLLIHSEGESTSPDDLIVQHLLPGTYYLTVAGLGHSTGDYTLTTELQRATPPLEPVPIPFSAPTVGAPSPHYAATGDFNGDGHLDLATANTYPIGSVSVTLGVGDGTFQAARNFTAGRLPFGIVAGDFNVDGFLDLATGNQGSSDVSVLLGLGDGTFAPEVRYAMGTGGWELDTADLNGDGFLDLVSANLSSQDVTILLGRGDGTFHDQTRLTLGTQLYYVGFGDFNADDRLDLVASQGPDGISLFLGNGDGTFAEPSRLIQTGDFFYDVVTDDYDGDGRLDLAVTIIGSSELGVLLGRGDGTFRSLQRWGTGPFANGLVTADFNGDGRSDLAAANQNSNDVSVLLGRGDGTFQDEVRFLVGLQPWDLVTGDFNGDGRPDLGAANVRSHDVSLLLGLGDGTFQQNPLRRAGEDNPRGMVTADFNNDGSLDLVTTSFAGDDAIIFLGRGDGTFHTAMRFSVGSTPVSLLTADFNGDGNLDLATANCNSNDVSILLGRGDGTFAEQQRYALGSPLEFGVIGDFNSDGKLDLFVGGLFGNRGIVLLGLGDGTFDVFSEPLLFTEDIPSVFAAGDFDGDGNLDLAASHVNSPTISAYLGLDPTDAASPSVSVYLGRGDGRFHASRSFAVGSAPRGIVTGDFNGDALLDIAAANAGAQSVSLLLGRGDGTFHDEARFDTGESAQSLVAADLNNDGFLDLAVSGVSNQVAVLLGRGDGTFQDEMLFPLGDKPSPHVGIVAGDFNGDGVLDLAAPEVSSNDVAVLQGSGDGSFQPLPHLGVGFGPAALVTDDFNGDGRPDVVSAHPGTNELAVALGNRDATLQDSKRFAVGRTPVSVLRADFNRDGRLDLAAVNFGSNDVSVLLGLGDGTFRPELRFAVGSNPTGLAAGDFDGDGRIDLAISNSGSNDVTLLWGRGDGTFFGSARFAAGDLPQGLAAGDFNGDGFLDLATANYHSQDVAVLLGRGNGAFAAAAALALGTSPVSLIAADVSSDGRLDLVTGNYNTNDVSVMLGTGNGSFHGPVRYEAGTNPLAVTVHDFDGDGRLDLATANYGSSDVALLLGQGDGTFGSPLQRSAGRFPSALAGTDIDGDGRVDLAVGLQLSAEVSTLQGMGDLTFVAGGTLATSLGANPLVADWNDDGVSDVAVLNREGKILLRLARPGTSGIFEAPVVLNPEPHFAARDLALVSEGDNFLVAALDVRSSTVIFYTRGANGTFTRTSGPVVPGTLPVELAAGDLNGDGRTDLVVMAAGSSQVHVYLRQASGSFGLTPDHSAGVGVSPSALELADIDGDGRLDIVVTNQFSGDVTVLRNEPESPFTSELRFRAGTRLYGLDGTAGRLAVHSREAPADVVAGQFNADGIADLIVTLSGSNSFALLQGSGSGGLLNPDTTETYLTGISPTVVVSGLFNDDTHADLAVLNEGSADLSVFLGDGRGGFAEASRDAAGRPIPLSAGNLPTGLAVHDVNGDGRLDLLVANELGDLLALLGNGDGTFQPYQRAGRHVALAVADLNGDGLQDFVFGNEGLDRVFVQFSEPGQTFTQERTEGVLAPGAVSTADLNQDGWRDLIIANGGANNVLVYLGIGNGQFDAARIFSAGTNPVGLTIDNLNDDRWPDLVVANEGSNYVSVFLGDVADGVWSFTAGPLLNAGSAPVSTTVVDATGDNVPDLLISNSGSDDVFLLVGVGGGFFNDQEVARLVLRTGVAPQQSLVGNFDAFAGLDLVTINAGSNNLTFFSNFTSPLTSAVSIGSGGLSPVAALVGDFNSDGFDDLVVANNDDSVISLLLGQESGLGLFESRFLRDVRPTALALADASANGLDLFVAGESSEAVQRMSFDFDFGPVSLATAESLLARGGARAEVADLLPLQQSAVALVATLFSVRQDLDAGSQELDPELMTILLDLGLLGDALPSTGPAPKLIGEQESTEGSEAIPVDPDDEASVDDVVTGQDEAFGPRRPRDRSENQPNLFDERMEEWAFPSTKSLDRVWQSFETTGQRLSEIPTNVLRAMMGTFDAASLPDAGPTKEPDKPDPSSAPSSQAPSLHRPHREDDSAQPGQTALVVEDRDATASLLLVALTAGLIVARRTNTARSASY